MPAVEGVCVLCLQPLAGEDWVDFRLAPFYPVRKVRDGVLITVRKGDKAHAKCVLMARQGMSLVNRIGWHKNGSD